jgi:hypothetical protein
MKESEWLSSTESYEMLAFIRHRATEQQFRLFSIACCRRIWPHITDWRSRRAVDLAELHVNGQIEDSEQLAAAHAAADALQQAFLTLDIRRNNGHLYHAAWAAALCSYTPQVPLSTPICHPEISGAYECAVNVAINCADAIAISSVNKITDKAEIHFKLDEALKAEYAEQCQLVRAIFEYPFSPLLSD